MAETAFLNLIKIDIHFLDFRSYHSIVYRLDIQSFTAYNGYLVVVKINNLVGIFDKRRGIGTDEILFVADADYERTTLACGNEAVGVVGAHNDNAVSALNLAQSQLHSIVGAYWRQFVNVLNKVG